MARTKSKPKQLEDLVQTTMYVSHHGAAMKKWRARKAAAEAQNVAFTEAKPKKAIRHTAAGKCSAANW
jgi:hypothetical protein